MLPDIDVAIVTFRGKDLVRRCLASLEEVAAAGQPLNVRVVDNASDDGTPLMVAKEFEFVTLIENSENRGFAAATNQALQPGSAPFVLVLNPDAYIGPETLGPLLRVLEAEPRVAAVGPSLLTADGTPDHAAKRSFPTIRGALFYFSGLDRLAPTLGQYAATDLGAGEVDAINGAFMLMRRAAFEAAGSFDEGYWMYMEDLDLCQRLRQEGWSVRFEPESVAWHDKGGSAGAIRSPRLNFHFHYGMYRYYRKWEAPRRPAIANVAVYVGVGLKLSASLFRGAVARLMRR